jgi:carboxymethylenebutenolidase
LAAAGDSADRPYRRKAIVKFAADKVAHEHIYRDQASVLVLLKPTGLPVAGAETERKVADKTLPSNRLMKRRRENGT